METSGQILLKIIGKDSAVTIIVQSDETFDSLERKIIESFQLKPLSKFHLLRGYPPTQINYTKLVIIKDVIERNETLRLAIDADCSTIRSADASQTTSIPKVDSKRKTNPVKAKTNNIKTAVSRGFGSNIQTLRNKSTTSNMIFLQNPKQTSFSAPTKKLRRIRQSNNDKTSTDGQSRDISEHLLNAINGGTGVRNRILRSVFRKQVDIQYDNVKAEARISAMYSGNYTIQEVSTCRLLGTGACTHIEVSFHKGPGSRSYYQEIVELIPMNELNALILLALDEHSGPQGREALKPTNLSKLSPRIFWSLIYRKGSNLLGSIKDILKGATTQPQDLSWLDERKRELSEKAKRNLEQKEMLMAARKKKPSCVSVSRSEVLQDATAGVGGKKVMASQCIVKDLYAHLSLHEANIVPESWSLTIIKYIILDEDVQRMIVDVIKRDKSKEIRLQDTKSIAKEDESYFGNIGIIGLTCLSPTMKTCRKLVSLHNDLHGLSSTSSSAMDLNDLLSIDQLDSWIANAQRYVVMAFWRIVCGNGSERIRRALESIGIATPLELSLWQDDPDSLWEDLSKREVRVGGMVLSWPVVREGGVGWMRSTLTLEVLDRVMKLNEAFLKSLNWIDEYHHEATEADDDDVNPKEADMDHDEDTGLKDGQEPLNEGKRLKLDDSDQMMGLSEHDPNGSGIDDDGDGKRRMGSPVGKEKKEGGWLFGSTGCSNEYLHRRVRVMVDDDFYEEGTVVGYWPPDEVEDDPDGDQDELWKVRLDPFNSIDVPLTTDDPSIMKNKEIRFHDLDKSELIDAINRFEMSCK